VTGPPVLAPRDARALARLVRRVAGKGFKLATVEVAGPAQREQVLGWVEGVVADAGATLVRCDLGALPGLNLWSELTETLALPEGPVVVAAWGLDGEPGRRRGDGGSGLLQQLNVQRDLLRRDLPVTWLVFLHPGTALRLWMEAPDFADFVGLRVRAQEAEGAPQLSTMSAGDGAAVLPATEAVGGPLALLWARLVRGAVVEARDWLAETTLRRDVSGELLAEGQAWLARQEGRFTDALAALDRAGQGNPDGAAVARRAVLRGALLRRLGRFDEAVAILAPVSEAPVRPDGSTAAALHELAEVLRAQGQLDGAKRLLERALAALSTDSGSESQPAVLAVLRSLAAVGLARGDQAGARALLERSLARAETVFGTGDHPAVAASLHGLAGVLRAEGDLVQAQGLLERALSIQLRVFGTEVHPDVAAGLAEQGALAQQRGELGTAAAKLRRALHLLTRVYRGRDQPDVAQVELNLALVLAQQGKSSEALSLARHALGVLQRTFPPDHDFCQSAARLVERLGAPAEGALLA
jgi:tetratricopeptide (TPR) repeat protein